LSGPRSWSAFDGKAEEKREKEAHLLAFSLFFPQPLVALRKKKELKGRSGKKGGGQCHAQPWWWHAPERERGAFPALSPMGFVFFFLCACRG
jgi:hypothetical protein